MQAMNSRVGVNMRYLGAVGCQPTAHIGRQCRRVASLREAILTLSRLATYSTNVGSPHALSFNASNSGVGANLKHFTAVGWQPTALIWATNAGYEKQGWGQHGSVLGL